MTSTGIPDASPIKLRSPWLVPIIAIVLVGLIIAGFGMALNQTHTDRINGGAAPDFELKTIDGGLFKLSQKRGQVVFINFWASWCGPCRDEAPFLNVLWNEFKDKGVQFIGVGYLDNQNDALNFMKETQMTYPSAPDDGGRISAAYKVKGVPQTYLIDKQGNISAVMLDPLTADTLNKVRAQIQKLVAS